MSNVFACACGRQLSAAAELVGRRVKCPACARVLTVPAAAPVALTAVPAAPVAAPPSLDFIRFDCPQCGMAQHVQAGAGQTVRCLGCGARTILPGPDARAGWPRQRSHRVDGADVDAPVRKSGGVSVLAVVLVGVVALLLGGAGVGGAVWYFNRGSKDQADGKGGEAAADGTKYEIKVRKNAGLGRTAVTDDTTQEVKDVIRSGGQVKEQALKKVESSKYTQETLETDGNDRPTKLRRTYDRARLTENDRETVFPYQGKTVLIEKVGERYGFAIDGGGPLAGPEARLLDEEFNKKPNAGREQFEDLFLPKRAVAVGDSWEPDLSAVARVFAANGGLPVDLSKATGKGTLVKVHKQDGKQFGVMEFKAELPLKDTTTADKVTFLPGGKLTLTVSLDACIDGTDASRDLKAEVVASVTTLTRNDGQEVREAVEYRVSGHKVRTTLGK